MIVMMPDAFAAFRHNAAASDWKYLFVNNLPEEEGVASSSEVA